MAESHLQEVRSLLLGKMAHVASKPFCLFRACRLRRLVKRLDAVERVIKG